MTPSPEPTKVEQIEELTTSYANALKCIISYSEAEEKNRKAKDRSIQDASLIAEQLRALKQEILNPV